MIICFFGHLVLFQWPDLSTFKYRSNLFQIKLKSRFVIIIYIHCHEEQKNYGNPIELHIIREIPRPSHTLKLKYHWLIHIGILLLPNILSVNRSTLPGAQVVCTKMIHIWVPGPNLRSFCGRITAISPKTIRAKIPLFVKNNSHKIVFFLIIICSPDIYWHVTSFYLYDRYIHTSRRFTSLGAGYGLHGYDPLIPLKSQWAASPKTWITKGGGTWWWSL